MKKKLFFSILFLSTVHFVFGQNFGSIGSNWHYSEHAGGMTPPNSEYVHIESVADTIIADITTHKITQTYYRHNGDTSIFEPLYVYEQSDTVFMYNFEQSRFLTTFIFNASEGDTLTLDAPFLLPWSTDSTYRLVIDTVEIVEFNGVQLKKYRTIALDEFQFYSGGYFMDRIGGLDWILPRPAVILEMAGPIRCFADNQIETNFQSIPCDYLVLTSTKNLQSAIKVNIFPNPVVDKLNIRSDHPIERIELTDLTGKKLLTTNGLTLNCEHINDGIYVVFIFLKSGQKTERKIIKQTL